MNTRPMKVAAALLCLAGACLASTANAQRPPCATTPGAPAKLLLAGNGSGLLPRASRSGVTSEMTVVDASGHALADSEIVFTLPANSSAKFFENGAKRLARTPYSIGCYLNVPEFITPTELGPIVMRAEVSGTGLSRDFQFNILETPAVHGIYEARLEPHGSFAAGGPRGYLARARMQVGFVDRPGLGFSGVPVTFTVPASGPSAVFEDGALSATVMSDVNGIALAPPMRSNGIIGKFSVKAASSAGERNVGTFANVGGARLDMVQVPGVTTEFPQNLENWGQVTLFGYPCEFPLPAGVAVDALVDGRPISTVPFDRMSVEGSVVRGCDASGNSTFIFASRGAWGSFGRYQVTYALKENGPVDGAVAEQTAKFDVTPQASGPAANGAPAWRAGAIPHRIDHPALCRLQAGTGAGVRTQDLPPAPAGQRFPWGGIRYVMPACTSVGSDQRVVVEFDAPVPAGAKVLWHGPGTAQAAAQWHSLPAAIHGNRLQFVVIDGGLGDADPAGSAISGVVALAVPEPGTAPDFHQGLWWGGPQQSGWGVGIAQNDARMFVTLYAYDDSGAPRWWVVPGGSWSADFATFTGAAYQPRWGSAGMIAGDPVGHVSLEFGGDGKATMRYQLGGKSGEHAIERQSLGAPARDLRWDYAGMWWYGAERNGEGVFIAQEHSTLFTVLYDYDYTGQTKWRVLPGGLWTENPYRVTGFVAPGLFSTRSDSSFFAGYDAARLRVLRDNDGGVLPKGDGLATLFLGYQFEFDSGNVPVTRDIERQPF